MDRARAAVLPLIPSAADDRAPAAIGRAARLELVFERRGERTVLAHSYAEPPLRVGRCFTERDRAHLIIASSAPGIFGGDSFIWRVHVGRGARVRLTSQSSLQVHPSVTSGTARVDSICDVAEQGELECQWHPLIPFAGSRLEQTIELRLAENASLCWSDAFMAGRAARGERWAFSELAHQLAIRRGGALEYLERYRIRPAGTNLRHPWVAGSGTYFGTTVKSGAVVGGAAEALHQRLATISGLRAAVDALADHLLLVRIVGESGVPFHHGRTVAESVCGIPIDSID